MRSRHWLLRDIGYVLAFKAAALVFLYLLFFAHPHQAAFTPEGVKSHILLPGSNDEVR